MTRPVDDAAAPPAAEPPPPRETRPSRFFLALIIGSTVLVGMVLRPIASELFLAAVLAGVLWPAQRGLARRLGGRREAAAGLLTAAVLLLILGPLATIATFVVSDGDDAVKFVSNTARSEYMNDLIGYLPEAARDVVHDGIEKLPHDLGEAMGKVSDAGGRAAAVGRAAAAVGANFALHATFMLIALFFLLGSGDQLVTWLDSVSPLRRGQTRELLGEFKRVSYAVIVSTVITSAVQAVAALIGYLITQVPNPTFFAIVTFFAAFIPAIGAGAICLVAALLLFATGHPYLAAVLAVWGIVVVGLVDNIVKPLLIKRGLEMHGAVVFFSLVGGIAAFGAVGLLLGPLAVAAFLSHVRMYHRDFSPGDRRVPGVPGLPGHPEPPGKDPTPGDARA